MNYDFSVKTIIIGDTNVGKSNILTKFADNEFNSDCSTTIGVDYKSVRIDHKNETIKLLIWDTAGQERFKSITKTFYKGSQVVIICFDLTNRNTFDNIDTWLEEIYKENLLDPIIVLAGTKADLQSTRTISKEEAIKKASQLKLQGYFETSSKTSVGIDDMFLNIIKIYYSFNDINKIKETQKIQKSNKSNKLKYNINKNIFYPSFCNIC